MSEIMGHVRYNNSTEGQKQMAHYIFAEVPHGAVAMDDPRDSWAPMTWREWLTIWAIQAEDHEHPGHRASWLAYRARIEFILPNIT